MDNQDKVVTILVLKSQVYLLSLKRNLTINLRKAPDGFINELFNWESFKLMFASDWSREGDGTGKGERHICSNNKDCAIPLSLGALGDDISSYLKIKQGENS